MNTIFDLGFLGVLPDSSYSLEKTLKDEYKYYRQAFSTIGKDKTVHQSSVDGAWEAIIFVPNLVTDSLTIEKGYNQIIVSLTDGGSTATYVFDSKTMKDSDGNILDGQELDMETLTAKYEHPLIRLTAKISSKKDKTGLVTVEGLPQKPDSGTE